MNKQIYSELALLIGARANCERTGNTAWHATHTERDKKDMIETGRATMYLVHHAGWKITNWPGSLEFRPFSVWKGKHNIARTRTDAEFVGPDGKRWRATQYGENNQIAHCLRVK